MAGVRQDRRSEGALRDGDRRVLGRAVSDNDTGRLKRGLPALRDATEGLQPRVRG
jgi:hypothetical protein